MKEEYEILLAVVSGYLDKTSAKRTITFAKLSEIVNTINNGYGCGINIYTGGDGFNKICGKVYNDKVCLCKKCRDVNVAKDEVKA